MKVLPFPGVRTVEDWTQEIDHALDPLRAVLLDASQRLNPDQRVDLCARASEVFAGATEVLTNGISVEYQISVLDHLTLSGGRGSP